MTIGGTLGHTYPVGSYSVHEDLLCFITHIRESKIVLYSEFQGMDSGFWIPGTGFRIL